MRASFYLLIKVVILTCLMCAEGYFLASITDERRLELHTAQLERDCEGVNDAQQAYGLRLVIVFASMFYAFFVFDIYGDSAGWQGATVLAVILIVCVVFLLIFQPLLSRGGFGSCLNLKSPDDNQSVTHNSLTKNLLHEGTGGEVTKSSKRESEIRMSTLSAVF